MLCVCAEMLGHGKRLLFQVNLVAINTQQQQQIHKTELWKLKEKRAQCGLRTGDAVPLASIKERVSQTA